tara:strand:- start:1266 stop:1439 length:174 start_codon:yes stop_codon:yes gene_type:complete
MIKEYNIGQRYSVALDEGEEPVSCMLIKKERGFLIFEIQTGERLICRPSSIFYIESI